MRVWLAVGGALVASGAGAMIGVAVGDGPGDDVEASDTTPPNLVAVERQHLRRAEELDGTTGHGDAHPLVLTASGTLTGLPAAGTVIDAGDEVAEVDGQPVVALDGPIPMWRDLGPGVADGKDVLQLEYVLASLGYAETHDVTVDEDWTAATTAAVKAFQADHGQDDDGAIAVGEIVWVDGPVRVDSVAGVLGQDAAQAGIEVTAPTQSVQVDLAVEDAQLLPVGATVEVEQPSGERTAGTVASVGTVETADDGASSLPVDITLPDGTSLPDGLPVTVIVTTFAADDALVVPVDALLALAEGGYAVEVADDAAGAQTHLVAVEVGAFADDMVVVAGDVSAGDQVVVP